MTPTEKQKCIAEQAVYGDLHCRVTDDNENYLLRFYKDNVCTLKDMDLCGLFKRAFEDVKPILRPLSALTKEITHRGYNDNKPFMPAAIICKMDLGGGYAINLGLDSLRPRRHIKENDLLHLLHFDTRGLIESGEAIDANTLDINPYAV